MSNKPKFSREINGVGESFDFRNMCEVFPGHPKAMVCANCRGGKCGHAPRDAYGKAIPEKVLPAHGYPDDALEQLAKKQFMDNLKYDRIWARPGTAEPQQIKEPPDAYEQLLHKLVANRPPMRTETVIREARRIQGLTPKDFTLGSLFRFRKEWEEEK